MMRSMYVVLPDAKAYPAAHLKDAIDTIDDAQNLLLRLYSNYTVALELINSHGIEHRLDEFFIGDRGMEVMCGLQDIKGYLGAELEDATTSDDDKKEDEEE